ncbi:phage head morphogenesis protein, partial [Escherichia coli]|nr:phage head morphogenesis protein [Escherichia coli]EEU9934826.1 phage head morphogenesis protein [Escherichia coli]EEY6553970.1 phage head morphogenesis protein [Escherichia coli]EEZ2061451.1 phage head morphogenesis protein [Escherichia coli]EFK6327362.1 phage head morphogenesis protein [Escherichia coli]
KHQNDGIALTPEDFGRLPAMLAAPDAVLWDNVHQNLLYITETRDGTAKIAVNAPYSVKRQPDKLDVVINAYRVSRNTLIDAVQGGKMEILEGKL